MSEGGPSSYERVAHDGLLRGMKRSWDDAQTWTPLKTL